MSVCHFLDVDHNAARPPVQATSGLAALGLDGPRPCCRGFSVTRKWQIVSGNYGLLMRLPLVGTEHFADYRSGAATLCLTVAGLLMEDTIPKPGGLGSGSTVRGAAVRPLSRFCPASVRVLFGGRSAFVRFGAHCAGDFLASEDEIIADLAFGVLAADASQR